MLRIILFAVLLCSWHQSLPQQSIAVGPVKANPLLFPIIQNELYGYIDSTGKVMIPPQFQSAEEFNEGLAAASINGRYGYINQTGNFEIKPVYDYVFPFYNGIAPVVQNRKFFHITNLGQRFYENDFSKVSYFYGPLAIAQCADNFFGLINNKGELVCNCDKNWIQVLDNGYFLATKKDVENKNHSNTYSIYDSLGQLKFSYTEKPYCRFQEPKNGIFVIEDWTHEPVYHTTIYNTNGEQIIQFNKKISIDENTFDGTYFTVSISNKKANHKNLMNIKGNLMWSRTDIGELRSLNCGRRIAQDLAGNKYFLIDEKGNTYGDKYENIIGDGFIRGRAIVKLNRGDNYIIIDSNRHQCSTIDADIDISAINRDGYFICSTEIEVKGSDDDKTVYGIGSLWDSIFIKPQYKGISQTLFQHGVCMVETEKGSAYIDRKNHVLWKEKHINHKGPLNTYFMKRGDYYAFGKDSNSIGGHALSRNYPVAISLPELHGGLKVFVAEKETCVLKNSVDGFVVYVSNDCDTATLFSAEDSRLYLKMQAKDETGEWRDIEYLPSSWCGNSYHTIILPKGMCWKFQEPIFEGCIKTKLRFKLDIKKGETVFSNEFNGSINPAQFWRKPGYTPAGIMDPYND